MVVREVAKNDFLANLVSLADDLLLFAMYDGAAELGKHHDGVIMLGPETVSLASKLLRILDLGADNMDGCDPEEQFLANDVETATVIRLRTATVNLLKSLVGLRSSTRIHLILEHVVKSEGSVFESDNVSAGADEAMEAAQAIKIYEAEATANLQRSLLGMLQYNDGEGELCLEALNALVMFVAQRYTFAKVSRSTPAQCGSLWPPLQMF